MPRTSGKPAEPAKTSEQDQYWYLRSQLAGAIARNWQTVLGSSPEIRAAANQLDSFVGSKPARSFRVLRPEEMLSIVEASDRVVLR